MTDGDNDRLRLHEFEALDEKRLQAQQRIELYQARSQRPLTKRSKSLPKERFGFSCQATYDHDTKLKANSNPNVKDLL